MGNGKKYCIKLNFEEAKLPPFQDILILGKYSLQGKVGLGKSFELLVPNSFEMIEIDESNVEAVFVNKRILAKMPKDKVIAVLSERVFPFISEGELIKVDFHVAVTYAAIEEEIQ